jgi:hypothetical protein
MWMKKWCRRGDVEWAFGKTRHVNTGVGVVWREERVVRYKRLQIGEWQGQITLKKGTRDGGKV